jgi:putative aldouronate transport system substrate-binding protein
MHTKYVFPNVFMTTEDTKKCSDLNADLNKAINTAKSDWVMNGFTDADWDKLQADLEAYGLSQYLEIHQKYFDAYINS